MSRLGEAAARPIDHLVADGTADPDRIYVTGISNGGMMAHRLGIEIPDRIAAIGPVAGALFGDEPEPAREGARRKTRAVDGPTLEGL